MGIRMHKSWSSEEDDYLKELYGMYSLAAIAKKLGRTPLGVEARVLNLGLGSPKEHMGFLTQNELAKIVGVPANTVKMWVEKCGLKTIRKITRKKAKMNYIYPEYFWKWAEGHKDKINFAKIPRHELVPEPDWVDAERRKDYRAIPKRTKKIWTAEEDSSLLVMLKAGATQKEIAERLNRSEKSVNKRLLVLRKEGNEVAASNKGKNKKRRAWLKVEDDRLIALRSEGVTVKEIAKKLRRSVGSVESRLTNLKKQGLLTGVSFECNKKELLILGKEHSLIKMSASEWGQYAKENDLPSVKIFIKHFGSWVKAKEEILVL